MCIILEDSFNKLVNDTKRNFGPSREEKSRKIQVFTTTFLPSLQNNALEVRAKTRSKNDTYDSRIYFENVEFADETTPNVASFKGSDNENYYIIPIDNNSNVKVNCTCLDFYYRFSIWNNQKNSLIGDVPPPYIKKRESNREPVNPSKSPGVCAHIIKLFDYVKREGLVK